MKFIPKRKIKSKISGGILCTLGNNLAILQYLGNMKQVKTILKKFSSSSRKLLLNNGENWDLFLKRDHRCINLQYSDLEELQKSMDYEEFTFNINSKIPQNSSLFLKGLQSLYSTGKLRVKSICVNSNTQECSIAKFIRHKEFFESLVAIFGQKIRFKKIESVLDHDFEIYQVPEILKLSKKFSINGNTVTYVGQNAIDTFPLQNLHKYQNISDTSSKVIQYVLTPITNLSVHTYLFMPDQTLSSKSYFHTYIQTLTLNFTSPLFCFKTLFSSLKLFKSLHTLILINWSSSLTTPYLCTKEMTSVRPKLKCVVKLVWARRVKGSDGELRSEVKCSECIYANKEETGKVTFGTVLNVEFNGINQKWLCNYNDEKYLMIVDPDFANFEVNSSSLKCEKYSTVLEALKDQIEENSSVFFIPFAKITSINIHETSESIYSTDISPISTCENPNAALKLCTWVKVLTLTPSTCQISLFFTSRSNELIQSSLSDPSHHFSSLVSHCKHLLPSRTKVHHSFILSSSAHLSLIIEQIWSTAKFVKTVVRVKVGCAVKEVEEVMKEVCGLCREGEGSWKES
ncbi:unnamed protein product [Moneuplotes crassus]|uniref:Uncharacterized protein n=1 Tax=Euplotes crassus TaxID=5936 RepID=A0AAD1U5B5_EUPCR|nr:unnamed protein product [Moneuplotes crassus]